MYRQVLIDPNQTALQRIVWRSDSSQSLKTFELTTVTYGTSSASFLAIRALRKLAEEHAAQYLLASRIALRDFYVDDLVSGADTLEEATQLKNELTQLLQEGRFELRKWSLNELSLGDNYFNNDYREFNLATDKGADTKSLGLIWNCSSDSFKLDNIGQLPPLKKLTKRSILSRIALIFDPLGLIGPVTVCAKIVMQDLWRLNTDWDESVPLTCYTKWKRYERELPILRNINVPRLAVSSEPHTRLEIHGFADASEQAFGACIYLRSTLASGEHITNLLCSKSRVAPLKSISLPRLELCAALILAQLLSKITESLPCKIDAIWLRTDSTIVLFWIQSCSRSWTPFVANRVGEIQQLTPTQYWHHISSQDNPADPLSRGVMPNDIIDLQIWWAGPPWLIQDVDK
ncbi:PREDICTED: uncharacterized protein LOC108768168 [Trachymyrmex cornetzi]|uniref:uncharacterized protein LOC108768168 n=1 Tax=Trachymyrmex cornetzi TaxID=471704 RepID=UPI00084EDE59|nr:PREDICTED: uncharacterized protein LOC108768168 [Trachymyrmex cornetzi]